MYAPFGFARDGDGKERLMTTAPGRCLLMAHTDEHYTAEVTRQFRRLGWDVHTARSGPEVRELARQLAPAVVILAAEGRDESGWLTCAKLVRELPGCKVILVNRDLAPECFRLAHFVGSAALVGQRDGVRALLDEVYGELRLPVAG